MSQYSKLVSAPPPPDTALRSSLGRGIRANSFVEVPVSQKDWNRYWQATRAESRGYWHGSTGRIAERLGFGEADNEEWMRMVTFHQPESPTCPGDSCHDYGCVLEAAAKCLGRNLAAGKNNP